VGRGSGIGDQTNDPQDQGHSGDIGHRTIRSSLEHRQQQEHEGYNRFEEYIGTCGLGSQSLINPLLTPFLIQERNLNQTMVLMASMGIEAKTIMTIKKTMSMKRKRRRGMIKNMNMSMSMSMMTMIPRYDVDPNLPPGIGRNPFQFSGMKFESSN
jgi:hypothetical protein